MNVRETRLEVSGLNVHLTEWDGGGQTTVLLLHGFLDVGRSYSFLVEALGRREWQIVAPDWRGHGQSDRIGAGGYYHFPDYVRDLEQIVAAVKRERLIVVGHSMGAGVAALWAGARPKALDGLVLLEAVGPTPVDASQYPQRMRRWLDQTAPFDAPERSMADFDAVAGRLSRSNRHLKAEDAQRLARWAAVEGADGRVRWRFDPLHRTRSPLPLPAIAYTALLDQIECPVLAVAGAQSPWASPAASAWLDSIAQVERLVLKNAGHMVHTERPVELAQILGEFVGRLSPRSI